VHYTCAFGMFVGFTVYALVNTFYIDSKLKESFPDYSIPMIRKITSIISPLLMIGFCVFDRTGYIGSTEIPRQALGSVFEIGLVFSFAVWVASLKGSTGGIKFRTEPYILPSNSLSCVSDFQLIG